MKPYFVKPSNNKNTADFDIKPTDLNTKLADLDRKSADLDKKSADFDRKSADFAKPCNNSPGVPSFIRNNVISFANQERLRGGIINKVNLTHQA